MRIGAKTGMRRKNERPWGNRRQLTCPCRYLYTELLGKLRYDIIIQLRSVALLEHRYGGLFTTHLCGQLLLRYSRFTAGLLYLAAEIWIKVYHGRILWTLFYKLTRG